MKEITVHTREVDGGRVMLRLEGELDIGSAGHVERVMRTQEDAGCRELILDLGDLRFIDSTGLRVVLSAHSRAQEGGWQLTLIPGPDRVQRVFQVAGLEDRLPFAQEGGHAGNSD